MELDVKKLISSKFAIKADKGNLLYKELKELLNKKENIILNFEGIETSTTRFFNVSIGKLYNEFDFKILDEIKILNANNIVSSQIEVCKNGAKQFYKNK